MANLPESAAAWPAGVYQIETTDPVIGGPPNEGTGAGMSNIPHKQLADRTAWLKAALDTVKSRGSLFAAASGTGNALVLTAGVPALVDGLRIRFRAPSPNSLTTVTVNLDGLGASNLRTITGAAPPVDYVRDGTGMAGVETEITYRAAGNEWIASRLIESGIVGDQEWTRWEDGRQIVTLRKDETNVNWSTSYGSDYGRNNPYAWAFAKPFLAGTHPRISVVIETLDAGRTGCNHGALSATGTDLQPWRGSPSPSGNGKVISGIAVGRWF